MNDADAEAFVAFRRAALVDAPLSFTASPADDFVSTADAFRQQLRSGRDWAVLGAFAPDLVGSVGLFRDRHFKASHRVHVWGVYVSPSFRKRGVAEELMRASIDYARSLQGVEWILLSVSSAALGALRLYEKLGFVHWGTEPDALRHNGQSVVENHMALRL